MRKDNFPYHGLSSSLIDSFSTAFELFCGKSIFGVGKDLEACRGWIERSHGRASSSVATQWWLRWDLQQLSDQSWSECKCMCRCVYSQYITHQVCTATVCTHTHTCAAVKNLTPDNPKQPQKFPRVRFWGLTPYIGAYSLSPRRRRSIFSFWGDVWGDCILTGSYRRPLVHNNDPSTGQGVPHQQTIFMESCWVHLTLTKGRFEQDTM